MARIRTLKPEIKTDRKLAACSHEARLTFVYLISEADDQGFLLAAPRQLLGALYPHDEDVSTEQLLAWIQELVGIGAVRWRETKDGQQVLELVNWAKHQRVEKPGVARLAASLKPLPLDDGPARVSEPSPETLRRPSRSDLGTGTELSQTNDPLPALHATHKPRASRALRVVGGDNWLTPYREAWERENGLGSFDAGQAARELRLLLEAGWSEDEIVRRIEWYLKAKGMEVVVDQAELGRRYFNPSITIFRKRFAKFDPSAPSEGDDSDSLQPSWVPSVGDAWASRAGLISLHRIRSTLHEIVGRQPSDAAAVSILVAALNAYVDECERAGTKPRWDDFIAHVRASGSIHAAAPTVAA